MIELLDKAGNGPARFLASVLFLAIPALCHAADSQLATATDAIHAKIKQKIIQPIDVPPTITIAIDVDVRDNGNVTRIGLLKTSGYPKYDEAVMEAVIAAQPLPMPRNMATKNNLRKLAFIFTPEMSK